MCEPLLAVACTCVPEPDDSQVVLLGDDEGRQQRQSGHVLALLQVGFTYVQGLVVLAVGDVELRCHVNEVIADQAGVSLQSLLYYAQSRGQVVTLIVTPRQDTDTEACDTLRS
ncbi:hypothetical protein EYF80_043428 [Liparis tanakae]|uniref:Uncharacterized protein n=1 Tax=Liparis tanakae TaxID=230148 RepID=A0A4Z2FYI8_9TELE|nr:hypothetical protein EYF80_043428 [Liparis tanakae]